MDELDQTLLRVCSYHRLDFDELLVHPVPSKTTQVWSSLLNPFPSPGSAARSRSSDLGALECLPAELLSITLSYLDIRAYFRFRHVNYRARTLATLARTYQLVASHGLEAWSGLLRTGLAELFTIADLYNSLTTSKCSTCDAFGAFLFLFNIKRCCRVCLLNSPHYRVISTASFTRLTGISLRQVRRRVPVLQVVPGTYASVEVRSRARAPATLLYEPEVRHHVALNRDALLKLERRQEQPNQRFMAATPFPSYDVKLMRLDRGINCKGCQIRVEKHIRGAYEDREIVYSSSGYLTHYEKCEEAQQLWADSKQGTRTVKEPEFTRRCGV